MEITDFLNKILPKELLLLISENINLNYLYEIRIREQSPICVNTNRGYIALRGRSDNRLFYADKRLIDYIICKATDSSLYSFNNQIKKGFITTDGGIRIGIAGDIVTSDDGKIQTIKDFSSLIIRVPHEIKNCAIGIMPYIYSEGEIKNTFIVSPPGAGKTTYLRDIARQLSTNSEKIINCLVVDERYEISGFVDGKIQMDLGLFTDCLCGYEKSFGFYEGIRAFRPDVILCDEIATTKDIEAIHYAMNSGVKVIATTHGANHLSLLKKEGFEKLIKDNVFDLFVNLSTKNGMGTLDGVFDSNFKPIFYR